MRSRFLLILCLGAAISVAAQTNTPETSSTTTTTTTTTQDGTAPAQSTTTTQDNTAPQSSTTQSSTMTSQDSSQQVEPMDKTPVYRVNVVQRTTRAVNYRHRGGTTKIDFAGTDLMPKSKGDAKVEGKAGRLEIRSNFEHM